MQLQKYKNNPDIEYNSLHLHYKIVSNNEAKQTKGSSFGKGISQTWLAKQLDMSFSMVNAYACNRIQPNLQTLQQFASILQVDLKDLITDKKIGNNIQAFLMLLLSLIDQNIKISNKMANLNIEQKR